MVFIMNLLREKSWISDEGRLLSGNSVSLSHQSDEARKPTRPNILGIAFLTASLFLGTGAQLLFKFGTLLIQSQPASVVSYFFIFCGLGIYAVGTGFWILCLRHLQLSFAYPFTGLTYVVIMVASWLLFDDKMSWQRIGGVLLICSGVVLIPVGKREST